MEEPTGSRTVDIEALHASSRIENVELRLLKVDRSYQREPNQAMVDRIANNWDEVSSELLLVSDRGERSVGEEVEGGMFVVNGQHRTIAATKKGVTHMSARIIDLSKAADPASVEALFRLRTNVRMGDKPLERFKAQLRAGNEESLAIEKIVDQFGSEINTAAISESGINAISAVERLYRVDDGALLRETFQILKDVYGVVGGKTTNAATLAGFAWFIVKHAEETDRNRVVEIMKATGFAALQRRAKTIQSDLGGTSWLNHYRAIVGFYNERLADKNKLEWKHGGSGSWVGGSGRWGANPGSQHFG